MKFSNAKKKYCEVDVLFSIPGRLRLRVSEKVHNPRYILEKLKDIMKISKGSYCNITNTFVFEYDQDITDLDKLIFNFCGIYAMDIRKSEIKVNYKLSKKNALGYSSLVSLAFIMADLGLNFIGFAKGSRYRNFIRWCAYGTTIGAIFEHGYKELNENGAFDPEVMSIMYLINSIDKGTVTEDASSPNISYSPVIAWLLTFGRHILTRQNQSIIIGIVENDGKIKITEEQNKAFFFNQFINSCFDVYQNVNVRKALK